MNYSIIVNGCTAYLFLHFFMFPSTLPLIDFALYFTKSYQHAYSRCVSSSTCCSDWGYIAPTLFGMGWCFGSSMKALTWGAFIELPKHHPNIYTTWISTPTFNWQGQKNPQTTLKQWWGIQIFWVFTKNAHWNFQATNASNVWTNVGWI